MECKRFISSSKSACFDNTIQISLYLSRKLFQLVVYLFTDYRLLSNAETGQYIYTNPLYTNSSNSEEIAGIINSNCKYKKALEEDGLIETYESRFRMSEIECQADLSHVYTLQRAYQSIRRHRRHKRQRRRRARH